MARHNEVIVRKTVAMTVDLKMLRVCGVGSGRARIKASTHEQKQPTRYGVVAWS